jgi:tetratricopeptide (TPR) repeat protein
MSKLEKQKEKARNLEGKDPKGAIEAWLEILKGQEEDPDPNPDLAIFNRIGDLYLKLREPAQAADYYDQAVDKYAELGFHNNAIAMCNKVLRNAPGRQTTYLKLAKLYASKGFMAEAKQNFVEYAGRMHKVGKIQQAFAALKELADISVESAHLRETLEEHLRMYGAPERHATSAVAPTAPKAPPQDDPSKSGKRKTSSLVFLDVDAPPPPKAPVTARVVPPPSPAPEPVVESLIEPVIAEPDTSLEIESTSLVEGLEPATAGGGGVLEGFETTTAEFGDVQLDAADVPSLRDEVSPEDIPPLAEFEPTVVEEPPSAELGIELEPLVEAEIEIEPPVAAPRHTTPPLVAPMAPKRPGVGSPPRFGGGGKGGGGATPKATPPATSPAEPPKVKPVFPKRPAPPQRKSMVEVPPLELEPDFETATTDQGHEVDDQPLAIDDARAASRRSGAIDLSVDGVVTQGLGGAGGAGVAEGGAGGEEAGSLVFADIEGTTAKPTIEELEGRVADDPDDPETHRALGEALIEEGERERGIEELDLATTGLETRGNLPQAQDLVDEILRLDPNSVRHRQKQVEFAFKSGDKAKLIDAYVELADTLLRSDLPDKARAVYKRVAEHDPTNERAKAALAMLAPVISTPPPEPKVASKAKVRDTEAKTAPRDAKLKIRDEAVEAGDFVDLSAMILEDDLPARDTRMKVADEEPTGDEERDFQEMLARFKQGIDENIDESDFQSHYDLGVAFKEMGLLDEAIAELQKALRAPDGKLRSSEALGVCFVEKGAYVVAESILRRALDLPASGDQERLGILYWLGRALEEQGKRVEARDLYGRVFAVDIRFRDVGERSKALAKAK